MLVLVLALVGCGPTRERAKLPCEEIVGDWIDVPEMVEVPAQHAGSASADGLTIDGHGAICDVECSSWEHAGIVLHWQTFDATAVAEGEWVPEDDDPGGAVALPAELAAYSANGSTPGEVSTCEITSTAGVDLIDVVVVE